MTKTKNLNKSNAATYRPSVTYEKAKLSYFIYANAVYSVAKCSAEVFREAVLAIAPHWIDSAVYGPLVANPEDLADRWFLLVGLAEARQPMRLYPFKADAERAMIPVNSTGNTRV